MYSPKIPPEMIRRLYLLKGKRNKPMTALVREALEEYLRIEEQQIKEKDRYGRNQIIH